MGCEPDISGFLFLEIIFSQAFKSLKGLLLSPNIGFYFHFGDSYANLSREAGNLGFL